MGLPLTLFEQPPVLNIVEPRERLAIALDFHSAALALDMVDRLEGSCKWLKVGMQLFYAAGASLVHTLRERNFEVFLDLKLHDIPNTVAGAVRSVTATGASLLTVHAAGGERMMAAALEAAQAAGAPRLVAVTVLTSMIVEELRQTGIEADLAQQTKRLALLAERAGITGMVCSAREAGLLRTCLSPETMLVVPGIRPSGTDAGDQRRIATPEAAIRDGASMLVVGRPVTQAKDPAAAATAILAEIAAAS